MSVSTHKKGAFSYSLDLDLRRGGWRRQTQALVHFQPARNLDQPPRN